MCVSIQLGVCVHAHLCNCVYQCMCVCKNMCMRACMYVCVYVHACTGVSCDRKREKKSGGPDFLLPIVCVSVSAHMQVYMCACAHVYVYASIFVCVHACVYACTCMYVWSGREGESIHLGGGVRRNYTQKISKLSS